MKQKDNETPELFFTDTDDFNSVNESAESIKYEIKKKSDKVICLGMTFNSEDERREYYREELRKKLPELKKIEGYPIGEDDDIINLSDPPYYTACPNPWLNDFIAEWEAEKIELEKNKKRKPEFEVHEPYASDVSEGKNNPIYNAHSYHTKVPHPAIMRYILHYTQPGDIVFDGFAGTGMTGVAAQLCGNPDVTLRTKIESEFASQGLQKPKWGARKAICGDLSPIASFIAYNYNTPVDVAEFEREAKRILKEVEDECGWMYETDHIDPVTKRKSDIKGQINFTVWSEVFICSNCGAEVVYWDAAVDNNSNQVLEEFPCNRCHAIQTKRNIEKAMITIFDKDLNNPIRQAKTVPVLIKYKHQGKRYEKKPDKEDINKINNINQTAIHYWYPMASMMGIGTEWGDTWRAGYHVGITHTHHFYTKRNLYIISAFFDRIHNNDQISFLGCKHLKLWFTSSLNRLDKLNRYAAQHNRHVGPLSNTLYISSTPAEISPFYFFNTKLNDMMYDIRINYSNIVESHSAINLKHVHSDSADYIFTDPPFGSNIMYSELNYYYEVWFKIITNNKTEAIENSSQGKGISEYNHLMTKAFKEFYRILKNGKWMTVEFSNTSAAVWNAIHNALSKAGFIIANVSAIDKGRPGLHGIIGPVAVKQDLVISCYKPSSEFDRKFQIESTDVNVWSFVEEHLNHLPILIINKKKSTSVIERSPKILYDRMISFYLMRGLPIPIDAADFQIKLKQKFSERDGMYFLKEQAVKYDKMKVEYEYEFQPDLFNSIYTENDAIFWLKQRLGENPQTYQDIQPDFRKANVATRKGEKEIELKTVLEENFIQISDGKWRIPDPNEAKDQEILRTKALIREFNKYIEDIQKAKNKKIKDVRVEALRAGFKNCWEKKDFATIISVGDSIPNNLLMEDEQLLMFYDIAKDKV